MGILTIDGRIRVAVATLHKSDTAVNLFLSTFLASIKHKEVIVETAQCGAINEVLKFFQDLRQRSDYNAVMVVTHGGADGSLDFGETANDPRPLDRVINSWSFLVLGMGGTIEDKLVIPAVCYAGADEIVRLLTTARPGGMALSVLVPPPGKTLDAEQGARAIARFLDALADRNLTSYEDYDLDAALEVTNKQYPGVLTIRHSGEAADDDWVSDLENP